MTGQVVDGVGSIRGWRVDGWMIVILFLSFFLFVRSKGVDEIECWDNKWWRRIVVWWMSFKNNFTREREKKKNVSVYQKSILWRWIFALRFEINFLASFSILERGILRSRSIERVIYTRHALLKMFRFLNNATQTAGRISINVLHQHSRLRIIPGEHSLWSDFFIFIPSRTESWCFIEIKLRRDSIESIEFISIDISISGISAAIFKLFF